MAIPASYGFLAGSRGGADGSLNRSRLASAGCPWSEGWLRKSTGELRSRLRITKPTRKTRLY